MKTLQEWTNAGRLRMVVDSLNELNESIHAMSCELALTQARDASAFIMGEIEQAKLMRNALEKSRDYLTPAPRGYISIDMGEA